MCHLVIIIKYGLLLKEYPNIIIEIQIVIYRYTILNTFETKLLISNSDTIQKVSPLQGL